MRPDSTRDFGAIQIIYLLTYLLTCRRNAASTRIHVDGDKGHKWIPLVSGLHVSGVNAA